MTALVVPVVVVGGAFHGTSSSLVLGSSRGPTVVDLPRRNVHRSVTKPLCTAEFLEESEALFATPVARVLSAAPVARMLAVLPVAMLGSHAAAAFALHVLLEFFASFVVAFAFVLG
ncbi:hypothetical protein JOL62DRAFT_585430 [Phyllosticta paracitricarpa]|uniref:Secreted protein n=1 Tax=Phyllosticta paracitricarpa TaxID=2016321 RepID=A0ABR1MVP2_9PEZI